MYVHARRSLTLAALIAIAGCGRAALTPSGPLAAPAGSSSVPQSIHAAYTTKKSLLFVADELSGVVDIYQTAKLSSDPPPIATIKPPGYGACPGALAVDKSGTIYVAVGCYSNDVELYPKGSTTMKLSITDGIGHAAGLAIDGSGTLYALNQGNYPSYTPWITEYAYGTQTPSKTVSGGGMLKPDGLALDKSGNLYIADFGADQGGANAVFELPAGGSSVENLNLSGLDNPFQPFGLAIDPKTGYLWVTGGASNTINVYNLAKGTSPIKTIPGTGYPQNIAIQQKGKPVGEVVTTDLNTHDVYAYKPGKHTPYATLSGFSFPGGVLITKP